MIENFGETFKQVLVEKNITIYKLSQITGISTTHLYRIQKNVNEPSFYMLSKISSAIAIDLQEYYKIHSNFNSLVEYESFFYLRELIEDGSFFNADKLSQVIKDIKINTLKEGVYKQLYYYVIALVKAKKNKKYSQSLRYCFEALGVVETLFNTEKLDKYITSEVSFCIISLIEYNYFFLGKYEVAIKVSENLIDLIEKSYLESRVLKIALPKIVFRAYITTINNIADTLFNTGEYEKATHYCEKGIGFLSKENSTYNLVYLFEILYQCNYVQGDFNVAKVYYNKAKALCLVNDDEDSLIRIEKRAKENYKILWGNERNEN